MEKLLVKTKTSTNRGDLVLAGIILSLTTFGLLMVANVSVVEAAREFGDKLYYFRLQFRWAILGIVSFLIFSKINYQIYKKFTPVLLVITIVSLILVLIPGIGIKVLGARRWLGAGPFVFQPAEMAKLSLILYLAAFLERKKSFLSFVITMFVFAGLIMLEPDLGTAVILVATGFTIYFAFGAPLLYMGLLGGAGILGAVTMIIFSSYRRQRLMTFLNPASDPLGASYHIRQILIAIGSGGWFGLGLGRSRQKFEFLPAATTDSIFAVIAEEVGFIWSAGLIIGFFLIFWRGLRIARNSPDDFGRLLAVGLVSWIAFQTLINLSAMVAVVPLTGVPLPFISYGGSSLVLVLTGMGILMNISKHVKNAGRM